MPDSICPKCSTKRFEIVEKDDIKGSNFKLNFVQCANCGTVVGVTDFFNLGQMLRLVMDKLDIQVS
ncbi:hypothetical protein GCM10027341_49210 [Spirosoma knui]